MARRTLAVARILVLAGAVVLPFASAPDAAAVGEPNAGIRGSLADHQGSVFDSFEHDFAGAASGTQSDSVTEAATGANAGASLTYTSSDVEADAQGHGFADSGSPPRQATGDSFFSKEFVVTSPTPFRALGSVGVASPSGQCCVVASARLSRDGSTHVFEVVASTGDGTKSVNASGVLQPGSYTLTLEASSGMGFGAVPGANHSGSADFDVRFTIGEPDCVPGSGSATVAAIDTVNADCEFAPLHYRVELKAWIPKAAIVDPNIPYEVPLAALGFAPLTLAIADERRPCNDGGLQALALLVRSNFRGDTHAEYDGSFRVRPVAEFDWDGSQITNFVVTSPAEHFGITSLDYKFRRIGGGETQECSVTKQQVAAAGGTQLSANSFELSMSADDPLVYPRTSAPDSPLVPNIDARLRGTVQPDGRLSIAYDTDLFPSHGLRVTVDGRDLETQVTNDVSCLADSSVQGLFGMGLLASALSAHINVGSVVVDPAQAPRSSSAPGRVCTGEFSTVDFVSLGQSLLGSARAASAASTLRVAPLDSAGKPGGFVTLKQAVAQGLVARQDISASHFVLGITPDQPVALRSRGRMALTVTRLLQGRRGRPAQFGPVTGNVEAKLTGGAAQVTRNGKRLRARKPDGQPPRTGARIRIRGKTAIVTVAPRDRSGIQATVATLDGKRLKIRRNRFRVPARKLTRVRVFSTDVYGNSEKPKRLRLR